MTSSGGTGGNGCENGTFGSTNRGGNGGVGRIAVYYASSVSGSSSPGYTSGTLSYNPYAVYVSNEIHTPGTTAFNNISWTEDLDTNGEIQFQTRSGNTSDFTDGTWEEWRPVTSPTNRLVLESADTHTNWVATNATVAEGDVARNVDFFEDEDESVSGALTKVTSTAANGYAEATISATNISSHDYVAVWVRSPARGDVLKIGFGEAAGNEQEQTFYIDKANSWQKVYWDIRSIAAASRDAVTKLRITSITNGNTIWFDNVTADRYLTTSTGSTITSSAANYIQYRAVLSTTNTANSPTLSKVRINLTNPNGTYTIDADRVRSPFDVRDTASSRLIDPALLEYNRFSLGTGADGSITVSSSTNINATNLIAGRSCADGGDAVNYNVTSLTSTTATVSVALISSGCLNVGDEVLLINLQGTNSAFGNTGNWETLRVASVSTNVVTFTTAKTNYYGNGATDDTNLGTTQGTQRVILQRVPNYTSVTINSSINFYPASWDGSKGGVMFFRTTGSININGTIHANAAGHRGGAAGVAPGAAPNGDGGDGGEAFCGIGGAGGATNGSDGAAGGGAGYESSAYDGGDGYCGGGGGSGTNTGFGSASQGGAGGGGHNIAGGGGAGYGTYGTSPPSRNGGTATGQDGGTNQSGNGGYGASFTTGGGGGTYGDVNLAKLYFGAGGGGGGDYRSADTNAGAGGAGGGIVYISANSVTVSGGLQSNAANGAAVTDCPGAGHYAGGGGGGAGGSIKVVGNSIDLGTSKVFSSGGTGGNGCENGTLGATNRGGDGGSGRIAVYYANSISGSSSPSYNVDSSVAEYNPYKLFISKEIATPGAISLDTIAWTEDLPSGTEIQLQTRSGNSTNSLDGTWEEWRPVVAGTNRLVLESADNYLNWAVTNMTRADGNITRDVNYFEDEDIPSGQTANKTSQFTSSTNGGYAEATIAATDISAYQYITLWVRASVAGESIKFGFGEAAATEQEQNITIYQANVWQKVYWDISDIVAANRDAVTKLRLTNFSTSSNTIYLDNVTADKYLVNESGSTITSTANNYVQYRAILSTTDIFNSPTLSEVRINYTDGGGSKTIDDRVANQNDIDQYDLTGRLVIDEYELDDFKSIRLDKGGLVSVSQRGDFDPGTGADWAVTVSSDTNINAANLISGRTCVDGGDAVNYNVTALTVNTATLVTAPSTGCLNPGDEILLINLQGTYTAFGNVGNYETLRVESIADNVVTFTFAKTKYYGNGLTDDTNLGTAQGTQRVMLQRVPNYTTLTVDNGVNFYPSSWDGAKGGVMFFRASVSANINGTVHANALGYRGGTQYGSASTGGGGQGGEAFCGIGGNGGSTDQDGSDGAAGGGAGSESTTYSGGNGYCGGGGGSGTSTGGSGSINQGGAGGGGQTIAGGGGAGYGTPGNAGQAWGIAGQNGGTNSSGNGGRVSSYGSGGGGGSYGDESLNKLLFGSGGGVGGRYRNDRPAPGVGGNGGGIIYILANNITVSESLSSNGGNGGNVSACGGAPNEWASGGGGGAGGSIKIAGNNINIGTSKTYANGGSGGAGCQSASTGIYGGAGGVGRIAVYYASSISGSSSPSAELASTASYNYSIIISDEIPTPNAIDFTPLSWLADLNTYGMVQIQTRTGKSNNSTDGTWEGWKPYTTTTNTLTLDNANTHTNWIASDATLTVADGDVTRDIDYYEDEDEATAGNLTKLSVGANADTYAERIIGATDINAYDYLTFWVRSSTAGNMVKFGFGESSATEHEQLFHVDTSNTWQKIYWDISNIADHEKDGVKYLRVTAPGTNYTLYFDNMTVDRYLTDSSTSFIKSTPDAYIQYRAILTSANPGYRPILHNVDFSYKTGYKTVQPDSNTVRLYNFTGEEQNVRLEAIVFGADLAEWYPTEDLSIEAGDVVAISGSKDDAGVPKIKKTSKISDQGAMGIISTKAGVELGVPREDRRLVGLSGRVPVKIAPDSAPIQAGDLLTSSSTYPGMATKATQPGFIVGKALERWNPVVQSSDPPVVKIETFISISWADPKVLVDQEGDAARAIGDTIEQGTVKIIPKIEAQEAIFERLTVAFEAMFETITAKTAQIASAVIQTLRIERVEVEGPTLGSATLPANETKTIVENPSVSASSHIFVTAKIPTTTPLSVTMVSEGKSFTVEIAEPQAIDVPFDYWIVEGVSEAQ